MGFHSDGKEKRDLLRHPVFVRFLIFVFLGGEGSLFVAVGDNSRGLKPSAEAPSGTRATESISDDSVSRFPRRDTISRFSDMITGAFD